MMKRISVIFTILLLFGLESSYANVIIIGSGSQLSSITEDQLKKLYLGKITAIGNVTIKLSDSKPLQEEFLSKYIGKSVKAYKKTWLKKIFAEGLSAPVVFKTQDEVINFVKSTKDAVGYVSSAPSGVTVLLK